MLSLKKLSANILSLGGIQFFNMVVPLISFPYLFRVLGEDYFGMLSFATSLILFAQVFIDFGTTNLASREIAILSSNSTTLKSFVVAVLRFRVLCSVIVFLSVQLIILLPIDLFSDEIIKILINFCFISAFAYSINCDWFFIGIQKNYVYLKIVAIFRIFSVALIFLLIKDSEDMIFVPVIMGGGQILTSIVAGNYAWKIINSDKRISLIRWRMNDIVKLSYKIFISKLSIDFYRGVNPIVLGIMTDYRTVAYYVAAEKVIAALQNLQFPIGRALMPVFSTMFSDSGFKAIRSVRRRLMPIAYFVYATLTFSVLMLNDTITELVTGQKDTQIILNLNILAFVLFFGCLNYLNNMTFIIPTKLDSFLAKSLSYVGIQNLVILIVFVGLLKDLGASYSLLLAELILFAIIQWKIYNIEKSIS